MTCEHCEHCKNLADADREICANCANWRVHTGGKFGSCAKNVQYYREQTTRRDASCHMFYDARKLRK